MEKLRIGINGFGRIGKNIWQLLLSDKKLDVCEINHPNISVEQFIYLAQNDTIFSLQNNNFEIKNDIVHVQNTYKSWNVKLHSFNKPEEINWDVDIVIDCTGKFKNRETLKGHLKNNVKFIILTAPANDNMPVIINGFNNLEINDNKIISCGSCTTNSIVPVIDCLNKNFNINNIFFLTVHAVTPSQSISDRKNIKEFRLGRNAYQNIIPTTTGANKLIGKLFPNLNDKVIGSSCRVPVDNGSYVEIVFNLSKEVVEEEILKILSGEVIKIGDCRNVSSDIKKTCDICKIDKDLIEIRGNVVKIGIWYNNEAGYAIQVLETIRKKFLK